MLVYILITCIHYRFAALALATDPPREDILDRPPDKPAAGLINKTMAVMICAQSTVQVIIMLLLQLIGGRWIDKRMELRTFIFNTFIFLQMFNEINCRTLGTSFNIFRGLSKNPYFILIWLLTLAAQTVIVQFGGKAFGTVPINPKIWLISITIGFTSIVIGVLVRCFLRSLPQSQPEHQSPIITANERWQRAYVNVQRSRAFYNAIRRERQLLQSPQQQDLSREAV